MSLNRFIKIVFEGDSVNCFDEILEAYQKFESLERKTTWHEYYYFKLVKLMQELKMENRTVKDIQNCLILMHNLFMIKEPDHYHKKGRSTKELDKSEKKHLRMILQQCYN